MFFFFFKQKTAYEMRISDWSSDVCSSDLSPTGRVSSTSAVRRRISSDMRTISDGVKAGATDRRCAVCTGRSRAMNIGIFTSDSGRKSASVMPPTRSEEHTSELQSLMRISYAVICLKKKNVIQLIDNKHT